MKTNQTRRDFIQKSSKIGLVCGAFVCCPHMNAFGNMFDDEVPDPKKLNYCGYVCPPECQMYVATIENDTEKKKEAYKLWKIEEKYGIAFDPDKILKYKTVNPAKAYRLLNTGALILVSTKDERGVPNLAPVAWQTPLNYDPVPKMIMVLSNDNKTLKNILETKKFVISVPHASQEAIVRNTGDCSGNEVNKMECFAMDTFLSEKYHLPIPSGVIGYLECEQYKAIGDDDVTIIFGKIIHTSADEKAFSGRILSETPEGKTLHHLGGKMFMIPGDEILD